MIMAILKNLVRSLWSKMGRQSSRVTLVRPSETSRLGTISFSLFYIDGERVRKQVPSDVEEAKAEAHRIAADISRGRIDLANVSDEELNEWRYCKTLAAKLNVPLVNIVTDYSRSAELLPTGVSHFDAARFYSQHRLDHTVEVKNIGAIVDEFLQAKEPEISARHHQDLRNILSRFCKSIGSDLPVMEVKSSAISDWICAISKNPRTRVNVRAKVTNLFNFAKGRGYLPRDKPTEAEMSHKANATVTDSQVFTPEQMVALYETLKSESETLYVCLCGFAKMRPATAQRLVWGEDIRLNERKIMVPTRKSKTFRYSTPITDNLMAILSRIKSNKGKVKIPSNAKAEVHRRAKELGFGWPHDVLRKSGLSYEVELTGDTKTAAFTGGHDESTSVKHYLVSVSHINAMLYYRIGLDIHTSAELATARRSLESKASVSSLN